MVAPSLVTVISPVEADSVSGRVRLGRKDRIVEGYGGVESDVEVKGEWVIVERIPESGIADEGNGGEGKQRRGRKEGCG